MTALITIHELVTWALVGLIWTIQIVHYPLFGQVGREGFPEYHRKHSQRITWVVAPLMFAELITAVSLLVCGWHNPWFLVSLPFLGFNWLSTCLIQVPLHRQLGVGFDSKSHRRLVATNWMRTVAWTLRGACLLMAN